MSGRTARSIANGVVAAVVALTALWAGLNLAFPDIERAADDPGPGAGVALFALALLFVGTGALIVRRQPRNSIGFIFCGLGLVYAEGLALGGYVWVSHARGGTWPLTRSLAYLVDITFQSPAVFGLFVFFFLVFPNGRLPSRRWRWLAYLAGASVVGMFVNTAFRPDVLNPIPIANPLGVEALEPFRFALDVTSFGGLVVSLFGSVASLGFRLKRSRGDERQQIKWFLSAAAVVATVITLAPFTFFRPDFPLWAWPVALMTSVSLIPIAAGVAISKYHLYDIDSIINRALVYSALTAILGATYLGSVVLLQRLSEPVTQDSDLAVAAATLAAAALFRPLRRAVQAFIDRRFYRSRYNAAATLSAFSTHLRDQVDLDSLGRELVGVVGTTMQPAHASLWLRPSDPRAVS